jgi:hypothetical protein
VPRSNRKAQGRFHCWSRATTDGGIAFGVALRQEKEWVRLGRRCAVSAMTAARTSARRKCKCRRTARANTRDFESQTSVDAQTWSTAVTVTGNAADGITLQ